MTSRDWLDLEVLVTVGTGGVGKTTVSAAMGLEAARHGRRVLVLTIDPARRLADALGVGELGHDPRRVPEDALRRAGIGGRGSLHAMMLDTKRTFDEMVARFTDDDESRDRILRNPIYRNLTDALAGSREYSAMEKLHQLYDEGAYDLIVLDTPPATHALDFLDAPRRLTGFLGSQFLQALLHPAAAVGRTGLRWFRQGSELVLHAIERITGLEFLSSISEFLLAFEAMLDGFRTRAHEVERLLRSPRCGFVLVAGPDVEQARRARAFSQRLRIEGIRLVGLVVNRVHAWPGGGPAPEPTQSARAAALAWVETHLASQGPALARPQLAALLVETTSRLAGLARRDRAVREQLEAALALAVTQVREIPLFEEDVHALEALVRMAEHLFGASRD